MTVFLGGTDNGLYSWVTVTGTATLAAMSALRAGAGKIAVATPATIAPGIALRLAEARVIAMAECLIRECGRPHHVGHAG